LHRAAGSSLDQIIDNGQKHQRVSVDCYAQMAIVTADDIFQMWCAVYHLHEPVIRVEILQCLSELCLRHGAYKLCLQSHVDTPRERAGMRNKAQHRFDVR